ncbi:MAG: 4Fe-4S cluster-binding domain-containing protein [Lachnospiraceae bacterium]|nr:4Fe-4S cluster-binding domain-containing protein [Lachnospiraceae bacterium]
MTEEAFTYQKCNICPRGCGVDRHSSAGFCKAGTFPVLARAALHYWEEPCISGSRGSGALFFSGCNLRCVYCQNAEISRKPAGREVSSGRLCELFYELKEKGANNINLVTADIWLPTVAEAISRAKEEGFELPFILNTSAYITVESLKKLEGLIDIYLPDLKYLRSEDAGRYSLAADYPEAAGHAIDEMVRQQPDCHFRDTKEGPMMTRGVLLRHLLLPGKLIAAKQIVKYLHERYGDHIYISLLDQYTPPEGLSGFPELLKRPTGREYKSLTDYAAALGITKAYVQSPEAAVSDYIPAFDGSGL